MRSKISRCDDDRERPASAGVHRRGSVGGQPGERMMYATTDIGAGDHGRKRCSMSKHSNGRVSLSRRFEVLKRDQFTCQYCGKSGCKLEVDHVVPVSKGGADTIENLRTACFDCNRGKSASSIGDLPVSDRYAFSLTDCGHVEYVGRVLTETESAWRVECVDAVMLLCVGLLVECGEIRDLPKGQSRCFSDSGAMMMAASPLLGSAT